MPMIDDIEDTYVPLFSTDPNAYNISILPE